MSQQPPYGSDPQQPHQPPQPPQPGQQPWTPYGPGAYPDPYGQFPQQPKSNTTRNVLLIVGGLVLLFCGGVVAFVIWAISNVDDTFDPDYRGSEDDPLTVTEGEAFEIRGFEYDQGWTIRSSPDGDLAIDGLRATNARDDEDAESVYLYFKFYRDNEQLSSISCSGGSSVAFERSVTLDCSTYGDDITGYDEIEVYDNSYSE